jgi:hypothetical protein
VDEVQSAVIALLSVSQNKCDKSLQSLIIQSPSADNIPAAKERVNTHTLTDRSEERRNNMVYGNLQMTSLPQLFQ